MSEKRKPEITLVAKKQGKKRLRVELYNALQWPKKFNRRKSGYRVRINGRWQNGDATYTVSEIMRQLRGWITGSR